jgi:error-prone DNA polymerase
MLPHYAELHCLSNFTFLRGAAHPEELVAQAAQLGYRALALTDECSLAGVVRAHKECKQHAIKLILGSELRPSDAPPLVVLATDAEGYGNLSALITQARRRATKGRYQLSRDEVVAAASGCLVLALPSPAFTLDDALWLKESFPGRAWLTVELLGGGNDRAHLHAVTALAQHAQLPLVAAGDVHMHVRERRWLQDTLTAIRLGTTLQDAGYALYANGERHLRPRERLARIYPAALLAETLRIAERCSYSLDNLRYDYPKELVPAQHNPSSYLRELTEQGMRQRWPGGVSDTVRQQIEHELSLIAELRYEPYFLTVHDVVRFARSRDILCQGRGSAANSAVCFCLGITEVDPARMNMLFERFISKERNEPPDIDVDFEHERREEVIQYIYEKYGRERAALAATVITYQPRSALRDVGKALGLELSQVERLSKNLSWSDGGAIAAERLQEAGFDPANPLIKRVLHIANELIGFPRHLSQHVGGFVIADGALSRLVPIENAAMPARTVIQWDKDDLDTLGLLKVDCLALGMLTAIHRAFDLVAKHRGRALTMAGVPAEDPPVYRMIQQADTVGVFQIESRAQMAMLPRLKPRNFYDLVIEVAIVRPGPIQGDMVHPYLRRRQGKESVSYPSPALQRVLERTLGVPIFQEQVMQVAMIAAGFSPGEADQLRRAMAAWRRKGGLDHFETRLTAGMSERGYSAEFAQQIFQQILGFGEYGFPESHAASFALLVYVSAWLKCHEPAAFTCALLNSQPMGFYSASQLVQDARRHGVSVRAADVCHSSWDCTLENQENAAPALRLGLRQIKGFGYAAAQRVVAARAEAPFYSAADLAHRARLNKKELSALADAGALQDLHGHRRAARWATQGVEETLPLFAHIAERDPEVDIASASEGQDIIDDYTHLGLTLGRHPLALLRRKLSQLRMVTAQHLGEVPHGQWVRVAGLVTCRQRPSSSSGVTFVTLEDETGCSNVVVWQRLAEKQRRELLSARLLGVVGKVERDEEVIHIIAQRLEDHSPLLGALPTVSRDFC